MEVEEVSEISNQDKYQNLGKVQTIINNYNKYKLLVNIFQGLILKLKLSNNKLDDKDKEIVDLYDRLITDYLILNKINRNDGKVGQDTNSNREKFSLLFVENSKLYKEAYNSGKYNIEEESKIKLLSIYEEELRTFIKEKNSIIKIYEQLKSKSIKNQYKIDSVQFQKLFQEIFTALIEYFEILNDIFENFKFKEIEKENCEILNIDSQINKIKNLMYLVIEKITSKLTSERNYKLIDYIRNNLKEENNKLDIEIKYMRKQLDDYTAQGEEYSNLVREYKKICNLIEVKKNKI